MHHLSQFVASEPVAKRKGRSSQSQPKASLLSQVASEQNRRLRPVVTLKKEVYIRREKQG